MKGVMCKDVYYRSAGTGRERGKEKENEFENYLNALQ